jgi:short-subunit dehydrogenase
LTAREELKRDGIVVSVVYPCMTDTNFEKNTIKDAVPEAEWQGGDPPFPADTADYVAQKILEGVESGEAEIFAHDWMKRGADASAQGASEWG